MRHLMLACVACLATTAQAAPVFVENFNAAGFDPGGAKYASFSDRSANVDYSSILDYNGWSFSGGALLAQNSGTSEAALLLNENGGFATITLTGLIANSTYQLSTLLSGDNNPGGGYALYVSADNVNFISVGGSDGAPGSLSGTLVSGRFTALSSSVTLNFDQGSDGSGASPMIDDIRIDAVPEPAAWSLMISGFGLIGMALRRRSAVFG